MGRKPEAELQLDERQDRGLVLPKSVVRRGLGHADRLTDHRQELERDPRSLADLPEGLTGEGGEPLVGGRVEEVERHGAALHGGRHRVERDPGTLERRGHECPSNVAAREPTLRFGSQDAEFDESTEVRNLDAGSLGCIVA